MKIIGGILLAIGILIAGGSGLCSLMLLSEPGIISGPSAGESLAIIGVVGGIPLVLGVGLAFLGYRLVAPKGTD